MSNTGPGNVQKQYYISRNGEPNTHNCYVVGARTVHLSCTKYRILVHYFRLLGEPYVHILHELYSIVDCLFWNGEPICLYLVHQSYIIVRPQTDCIIKLVHEQRHDSPGIGERIYCNLVLIGAPI